ncbi:MAG: substrate-binding domain-containing protein [Anaerolineae bacterium]
MLVDLHFVLDSASPEPYYAQLARQLRQAIAAERLQPGSALPPVRTLAQALGCTPGTVARAYAALQREGLLTGRRGGGTHVADVAPHIAPALRQAHLVNEFERTLLDALSRGHSPSEVEAAFGVALARWRAMSDTSDMLTIPEPPFDRLVFVGSHDVSVEVLLRLVQRPPSPVPVTTTFVGSMGGLQALSRGEASLAGIHLMDSDGQYNVPFVRYVLPGQPMVLIRLATRQVGWIVPTGNPLGIGGWEDLARSDVRLVNRQPGSGTRLLLDLRLRQLGGGAEEIACYDHVVDTHLAVAEAVARGAANLGLGIFAAAQAAGLGFVPLTQEPYDLVVPASAYGSEAMTKLVATLSGAEFQGVLKTLGGYDVEESGRETWLLWNEQSPNHEQEKS